MKSKRNTEAFLATMRKRFAQAQTEERDIRYEAELDLRFVGGEQWREQDRKAREDSGRPVLTFNRLPTFVQQVTNESRQNKPSIKFSPVDNLGDPDTAKVYEGLARHIQYASKAQVAYDTAIDYSASGSFGYFRLLTDYCRPNSFDLDVKFATVNDPFSVYGILIPKIFGRKPRWGFVVERIAREDYEAEYPDSEIRDMGFAEFGDEAGWISEDDVRVAEYFCIESKRKELALLEDGSVVDAEKLPEGTPTVRTRTVTVDVVKHCKTNGYEILPGTETEWVGDCIPIFAALGRQMIIAGKPHLFSLVRFQRDPQRMINFYKTGIAERIGLLNRAPYIGYEGQFQSPKWQNANNVNYPYLEATPIILPNGQLAPLPQRQNLEGQINDLSAAAAQEIDDLKAIAGIFDASLGQRSNETSGIAIARRQQQSSITNLHFIDNLNRAQEEAGSALAYILPRVYDTAREVRIVGEDEEEKVVRVNEPYQDPETGEVKTYMLDADKYDVKVNIGPSFTTKRQEAAELYAQIIKAAPELMNVMGDIYFRNSDMAGADEASERMKKFIGMNAPGLIEDEKKQQIPPQVQAQMAQMGQMVEQLTATVNQQADLISSKKLELESRERIAAIQAQTQLVIKQAELSANQQIQHAQMENTRQMKGAEIQSKEGVELLKAEVAAISQRLQLLHADQEVTDENETLPQAA